MQVKSDYLYAVWEATDAKFLQGISTSFYKRTEAERRQGRREQKSSGEPQITTDGSKLVRETWRQRKGTESSSGKATWRSREKITERRARGKKATTEQNESEEGWKEGRGRKMSILGRESPASKKKINL